MKLIVMTGSPHKHGTTNVLVEAFIRGAEEAGNEVTRFDCAFAKVHPCIGCEQCVTGNDGCVFKDDLYQLCPELIEADAVVFATPLYYHGYSAQLKAAIDRFHGIDELLQKSPKKSALLAAGANPNKWIMDGILTTYHTELRYLGWQDVGSVLATGCYAAKDIEQTEFPRQAYLLGKNFTPLQ